MSLRAFTLLEALIALVLLAGLAAIVAPTLIDRLDEHAFESAADGTSEQLLMARAHAQATGEAVQVTYSPATGNVEARFYAPWDFDADFDSLEPGTSPLAQLPASGEQSTSAAGRTSSKSFDGGTFTHGSNREQFGSAGSVSSFTRSASGSDARSSGLTVESGTGGSGRSIAEPWATRPLGKGMRLATQPPFTTACASEASSNRGSMTEQEICLPDGTLLTVVDDRREEPGETLDDLARSAGAGAFNEVRLAVFMPDGSAMMGENLWLDDGRGRMGMISINAWSGLPVFQRLSELTARAEAIRRNGSRDEGELDASSRGRSRTDALESDWTGFETAYDPLDLDE